MNQKQRNQIVLDTSIVMALLGSEDEREGLLQALKETEWLCAESIIPEIGNAISAMFKRGRITLEQGTAMIQGFHQFRMRCLPLQLQRAVEISHQFHIYAYDAYVLECAERFQVPLLTFDARMQQIAHELGIVTHEV